MKIKIKIALLLLAVAVGTVNFSFAQETSIGEKPGDGGIFEMSVWGRYCIDGVIWFFNCTNDGLGGDFNCFGNFGGSCSCNFTYGCIEIDGWAKKIPVITGNGRELVIIPNSPDIAKPVGLFIRSLNEVINSCECQTEQDLMRTISNTANSAFSKQE